MDNDMILDLLLFLKDTEYLVEEDSIKVWISFNDLEEDEPYINLILDYIKDLENKIKKYKYSEIPYLKGYIQGLEKGIKENKDKDEFYRVSWKEKHYQDYMYPFGYDYTKTSYLDNQTKEKFNEK